MTKKYTDQQKALKLAWLHPEKPLHFSKDACRGAGYRPCVWKFWTNGVKFNLGLGKPWVHMGGKGMPVSQFTFGAALKPFNIILWWGNTRLFWIGDWEWKRELLRQGS